MNDDVERAARNATSKADDALDTVEDAHDEAGRKASPLAANRWFQLVARIGYIVTGLIYLLIGVTTIRLALSRGTDGSADQADQHGAVQLIEAVPGGVVVCVIAAIATIALALWLLVEGFVDSSGEEDRKRRYFTLIKFVGKAVAYGALGITTLKTIFDSPGDTEEIADDTSAELMQTGFGAALLVIAGLAVLAFGIGLAVRGITRKFVDDLDLSSAGKAEKPVIAAGVIGYVARGVAFSLIGLTFIVAVFTRDPEDASGMSGALASVLEWPLGQPLLIVIGVGLIIGGVATALRAKFQKMREEPHD